MKEICLAKQSRAMFRFRQSLRKMAWVFDDFWWPVNTCRRGDTLFRRMLTYNVYRLARVRGAHR